MPCFLLFITLYCLLIINLFFHHYLFVLKLFSFFFSQKKNYHSQFPTAFVKLNFNFVKNCLKFKLNFNFDCLKFKLQLFKIVKNFVYKIKFFISSKL